MTEAAEILLAVAQEWLAIGTLVFLRVGAAFLVMPSISEQYVPVRVRLGAALAVTAFMAPTMSAILAGTGIETSPSAVLFATEPIAGLLIGLSVRFVVHTVQIAGSIAAQSTSLSQIAGGVTPDPQPAISGVLMISALTLAVIAGLHVHIVEMLMLSYQIIPAGILVDPSDVGHWGTERIGAAFSMAFSLAAPFLIASVLYNLALGVINKAMPQLMVAFVGAPAITFGGLLLLFLSAPLILPIWLRAMQIALSHPMSISP